MFEFSARNVGPNVYTLPSEQAKISASNCPLTVKKAGVAYSGFNSRVGAAVRAYLDPTAVDAGGQRWAPSSTVEVNKILVAVFRDVPELMLATYSVALTATAADFALTSVGLPKAGTVTVNGASV